MFSDVAKIHVKAGDGGNGRLSFLHEKYREFGGPDGGDGGDGGDIIFKVDPSWNTLYYYKTHRKLTADNGEVGKERKKHGKNAENLIVKVPIGTTVYNDETGEAVADLTEYGQEAVLARGGEGGYGNAHFTSSTRQSPAFAELGTPGEEFNLRLELKLIADVGLVGLPNVGKSTLLSVVTSAKPKIANYPFTTLTPNLGVVEGFGSDGFVIADIPGLIEGASLGKGIGDEFLRHIERTRVLLHIIDGASDNLRRDFEIIEKELRDYNKDILDKPQILAISRIDLLDEVKRTNVEEEATKIIKDNPKIFRQAKKPFLISAATHFGLEELIREIDAELKNIPKVKEEYVPVITIKDIDTDRYDVKAIDGKFYVTGKKIEKFATKTDFTNDQAVMRLYDIMKKVGILKRVEKLGGHFGDKIVINEREILFRG